MIPFPSLHRLWPMAGLALSALALSVHAQKAAPPKPAAPSGALPALTGAPGEEENEKEDQKKRAEFRLLTLSGGKGRTYDPQALLRAKRHIQSMPKTSAALPAPSGAGTLAAGVQPTGWTSIGPGNIGGRTRSIVTHPTDPNILYAGAVGGGVWKTTNGGASWFPLNDFMASIAVSTLVMDPTNPNVLYAGTGEGYSGDGLRGVGVFKTTNAGATWVPVSSTADPTFWFINRLAIHPTNPSILLIASHSGLHRSADGGGSWTQVSPLNLMCDDVDFNPANGSQVLAACEGGDSRVMFSTDAGATWTYSITPLPSYRSRTELAYSRSNPSIVYASADYHPDLESGSKGYLYRSQDGGRTWSLRNTDLFLWGQGWYDNAIFVDPVNPDIVMVGGVSMFISTDGGQNLVGVWYQPLHADQHVIVPASNYSASNRRVYVGNDGGIYTSSNILDFTGAGAWASLNNDYAVTQFYGGNAHPSVDFVMGGTQDNGTPRYAGNRNDWIDITWADGGAVAVDPRVDNGVLTFYGETQNGGIWRMKFTTAGVNQEYSYLGGSNADWGNAMWVAPIVLDPNDPERLYHGRERLWRLDNPDGAMTPPAWVPLSPAPTSAYPEKYSAIAVAKGKPDIVWTGGGWGTVQFTANARTAVPKWDTVGLGVLPSRYVTRVTIDPANSDVVYVTYGGFETTNVWRTTDAGKTWTNIQSNLPAVPVRSLVVHPQNSNWIYVGTEAGVFASENRGGSWSVSNEGPTNASVDELFFVNNTLYAATHGRGMWRAPVDAGTPRIALPGRIQAEDYKAGGQGVGYNDLTAGNTGGVYRTDGVDIQATTDAGGGYNVGWTQAGEWLAYDVNVRTSGVYSLTARMASGLAAGSAARTLVMSVDGVNVATFNLTTFGGWQAWQGVTVNNVRLEAGNRTVRLTMTNGDFNVNWVDVTAAANQAPTANAGADRTVSQNTVVTLEGGGTDPDNGPSPLTYAWTQVSGPSAVLTGPNTARPAFTASQAGVYVFRLVVNDGAAASAPDEVSISSTSNAPAIDLPGRIQAEAYRAGGPNVGYRDLSAGNSGGAGGRNDDVDIEATTDIGGGFNVGYIDATEWLAYDVRVATSRAYTLTARVASASAGTKTLRMLVDGSPVATFSFTEASGWQSWRDVVVTGVNLTAGNHLLTLEMTTGGFNLNWVDVLAGGNQAPTANAGPDQTVNVNALVTLDGRGSSDPDNGPSPLSYAWTRVSGPAVTLNNPATAQPTFTASQAGTYVFRLVVSDGSASSAGDEVTVTAGSSAIPLPGRLQAEDFKAGGQGVGYNDLTAGNTGGAYRPAENVDIEATADAGGGFNVGWVQAGEWLAYDVHVATAGTYTLTARMASQAAGTKTLTLSVDGANVATFNLTDASGWQSWRDVAVTGVNLTAGAHVVRLSATTGDFNVNYVDVAQGSANEILVNGNFANGLTGWNTEVTGTAAATFGVDAGAAKATITAQGGQTWEIQITQPVSLVAGKTYTLEFDVKAEATPKNFKVVAEHIGGAWTKYHEQQYTVTAAAGAFQRFKITWVQSATDAQSRVGFHFGTFNVSDVWVDNASLK